MPRGMQQAIGVAAAALAVCLAAFNLVFGDLNQDEGWYLYAARLVAGGQMPYRDFAFTQGPVLPLVYGALSPLWSAFGVAGGRVLTAVFGLLTALAAAALAARLTPDPARKRAAAFTAFCLIALNMYQSYFTVVVKTYALCGLLLALGFLFLTRAAGRRGAAAAGAAGVCLAAAAATRLSAFLTLPAALFFLWLDRRGPSGRAWAWFMGAGLLAGALFFLPFYRAAPEGFLFGLLDYHAGRSAGGLAKALINKAGFFSRVAQAYFPALALWVAGLLAVRLMSRSRSAERFVPARTAIWVAVAAMTGMHLVTAFPYDDYQAPVYPLFAAAVAAFAIRLAASPAVVEWVRGAVFVGAALFALGSPLNQEWVVRERDRIWWRMKEQPPLLKLREAGETIRRLAPEGGELLTQDVYLAVEAGMTVPRGFELGQFCYFPGYSDNKARELRVVNDAMMRDILRASPARLAAFSGYGLAMRSPEVVEIEPAARDALWAIVRERYEPAGTIPHFGQASTTLQLLTRSSER